MTNNPKIEMFVPVILPSSTLHVIVQVLEQIKFVPGADPERDLQVMFRMNDAKHRLRVAMEAAQNYSGE